MERFMLFIAGCFMLSLAAFSSVPSATAVDYTYEMKVQLMYDSTLAQYFSDTTETESYLATFVQQVNTILAHKSLSREVQLRLSMSDNPPKRISRADEHRIGLPRLHRRPTGESPESLDTLAGATLRQFCRFADARRFYRHLADYGLAILLTGLPSNAESSRAPLGIAYRGGACWPGVDCVLLLVPRRRLFRIAFTAAHELGHGLRLRHQSGAGGVMMSRRLAADWPDAFRWAADSAKQLRQQVEAMGEHSICMRRRLSDSRNESRSEVKLINSVTRQLIRWNSDRVCHLVTGGRLPISSVPFKSMQCRMLCCHRASVSSAASLSAVASTTGSCSTRISAFNGVTCGNLSIGACYNGQCVLNRD